MSCHNLQSLILQFHTPTSAYQWPQVKKGPNYTAQGVRQEWKQTVPCSHLIIRCRKQRTIHGVRPLQKHLKSLRCREAYLADSVYAVLLPLSSGNFGDRGDEPGERVVGMNFAPPQQ